MFFEWEKFCFQSIWIKILRQDINWKLENLNNFIGLATGVRTSQYMFEIESGRLAEKHIKRYFDLKLPWVTYFTVVLFQQTRGKIYGYKIYQRRYFCMDLAWLKSNQKRPFMLGSGTCHRILLVSSHADYTAAKYLSFSTWVWWAKWPAII